MNQQKDSSIPKRIPKSVEYIRKSVKLTELEESEESEESETPKEKVDMDSIPPKSEKTPKPEKPDHYRCWPDCNPGAPEPADHHPWGYIVHQTAT